VRESVCGDTERMAIRPGTDIAGYRIDRVLGNGGTGTVALAHSRTDLLPVALKLVERDLSADQAFRRRFGAAAELVATLDHPNIVPTLDLGETVNGQLWMAMPFVDGLDADRHLRAGQMPPERAVRILVEVAGALDYIHGSQIVHGDVKPANFLLGSDSMGSDTVFLGDFSLARHFGERDPLSATGMVLVSAAYASPEALRAEALDGRADIYSLGCALFRLLTGKPPFFDAGSKSETVHCQLHRVPPAVTRFAPWLPPAIDDVIATAMAKDPASRYPTAGALASAVTRAMR